MMAQAKFIVNVHLWYDFFLQVLKINRTIFAWFLNVIKLEMFNMKKNLKQKLL